MKIHPNDPYEIEGTTAPWSPYALIPKNETRGSTMTAAKAWMALGLGLFISGTGTALSLGLLHGTAQAIALTLTTVATGIGTATGVYKVSNTPLVDPLPPKPPLPPTRYGL